MKLVEKKDIDYILDIGTKYKYNKLNREQARKVLEDYGYKFWEVYVDGKRSGVVYISYIPQLGYTLDAYKDQRVKNDVKYSYLAGKQVVDYFHKNIFSTLYMIYDKKNRAIRILAKKLGFTKVNEIVHKWGIFTVMRRDK